MPDLKKETQEFKKRLRNRFAYIKLKLRDEASLTDDVKREYHLHLKRRAGSITDEEYEELLRRTTERKPRDEATMLVSLEEAEKMLREYDRLKSYIYIHPDNIKAHAAFRKIKQEMDEFNVSRAKIYWRKLPEHFKVMHNEKGNLFKKMQRGHATPEDIKRYVELQDALKKVNVERWMAIAEQQSGSSKETSTPPSSEGMPPAKHAKTAEAQWPWETPDAKLEDYPLEPYLEYLKENPPKSPSVTPPINMPEEQHVDLNKEKATDDPLSSSHEFYDELKDLKD